MATPWDVIVIGGGHNGLVVAAYLARAGRRVLVLERRPIVGGACVTEEILPGFRISSASYVCSLLRPKIIRDLDLPKFGFELYIRPAIFVPYPDGQYLFFWPEMERTVEEIRRFSPRDAAAYPEFDAFFTRLAQAVEPHLLSPPPRFADLLARLPTEVADTLLRVMFLSVKEVLDQWFESDHLKGPLAYIGLSGVSAGPWTPGTAYVKLYLSLGEVNGRPGQWGYVRGGMGGITQALARSATHHGAVIRTQAEVERVMVRGGQATGVVLVGGEEVLGTVTLSNADPKRTFLKLVPGGELPPEFVRQVQQIRMEGTAFKINCALGELPDFRAYPGTSPGPQHSGGIMIAPSLEYMEQAWDDAKYGRPSRRPFFYCHLQSVTDPSLAPPGKHTMTIYGMHAPYRLREGTWPEIREQFGDRVIDLLADYAPNIKRAIIHREVLAPPDLEERFGLTGGQIYQGELTPDQSFALRPMPGWSQYRTPVRGLYLCGSGAYPGGAVSGAPGYNAAHQVLTDWAAGQLG